MCEEGKEAFKDGKINFSTAYETSRLPEEKQHEVIENGELLNKDVREMVKEEREKKEAEKKPGDDYDPAHRKVLQAYAILACTTVSAT